jgi:hypothetical protein
MIDASSPLILTLSQIAEYRGQHRCTLYAAHHAGRLPYRVVRSTPNTLRVPLLSFLQVEELDMSVYWDRFDALPDMLGRLRMKQELGMSHHFGERGFPILQVNGKYRKRDLDAFLHSRVLAVA